MMGCQLSRTILGARLWDEVTGKLPSLRETLQPPPEGGLTAAGSIRYKYLTLGHCYLLWLSAFRHQESLCETLVTPPAIECLGHNDIPITTLLASIATASTRATPSGVRAEADWLDIYGIVHDLRNSAWTAGHKDTPSRPLDLFNPTVWEFASGVDYFDAGRAYEAAGAQYSEYYAPAFRCVVMAPIITIEAVALARAGGYSHILRKYRGREIERSQGGIE